MMFFGDRFSLDVRPSWTFCGLILLISGLAVTAVWLANVSPWLSGALSLAALCYGQQTLVRSGLLLGPKAVVGLRRDGASWYLREAGGGSRRCRIDGEVTVTPWLIVMVFRDTHNERVTVPIFHDGTDPDSHRRLRGCLRLYQDDDAGGDRRFNTRRI